MINSKSLIAFTASAALFTFPSAAMANDQDVRATTIPASVCQPSGATGEPPAQIVNGAYIIRGNSTGRLTLYCPLSIDANTISDVSNDNDITRYRVCYRDSDGAGNLAEVRAQLHYRGTVGGSPQVAVGVPWSSNTNPSMVNTCVSVPLNHDLGANQAYYFIVTIRQNNTVQEPAFGWIDFPGLSITGPTDITQ
jgi:hypothetical protein